MPLIKNGRDRRRYPRFEIPVQLRPVEIFGKEGRVQNISTGGMLIYGTMNIELGTTLRIDFALPSREWIMADVEVVWSKERSSQSILKYDIGCRFEDIPPESKKILDAYLARFTPKLG